MAPHCQHLRNGVKMGDFQMIDTMIKDGLWDAFNGYHMGNTAENVARQWQITRDTQDNFAVASQNKAEAAQKAGSFKDEIVPVTVASRKGDIVVDQDEYIRHGATLDQVAKLQRRVPEGRHGHAGNASGINDGAAAVILMSAKDAESAALEPLARIVSWAHAGVDPAIMGSGPIPARARRSRRPAGRSTISISSRPMRPSPPRPAPSTRTWAGSSDIVNVNGGAIAIGHPIGASGARVLVTLLHEMGKRKAQEGPCDLVHRRRHGHRHVRRTRNIRTSIAVEEG